MKALTNIHWTKDMFLKDSKAWKLSDIEHSKINTRHRVYSVGGALTMGGIVRYKSCRHFSFEVPVWLIFRDSENKCDPSSYC